ncbi:MULTISPECIES: putative bifunctional diguanylate cyclase/phosphodiesterase [Sphingomonas]|uniref:putative bifunctional diguanylate cyclase/phosphodiesterase n=1 Tax=Sphingomonas TaxID=13687 RepID=UPI000DEFD15A|nr:MULTISPECIES: EAL domain-containing protein [Sphingomonas]
MTGLPPRTSVREALFFDVAPTESAGDGILATRRVRTFSNGPMLLAASHAVVGITVLCYGLSGSSWRGIFSAVLPLLLAMLLDGAMGLFLAQFRRLNFAPHSVGRITMAYLAGSGVLWMLFAGAASRFEGLDQASFLPLVLGAGLTMRSLVSFGSPPLSIVNALVATFGAFLFSGSTEVTATIGALSLLTVGYSVAVTRLMLANARRRLQLDHLAQKALHFVEEFEASGRGWFWETNSAGTLSYVSQQLADDFKTTPSALLGRQFTDLLSVDMEKGEEMRDERTLGFHLSARFPFSDVVVRPASDPNVHWSLSGNPIFDDNGRFLGFRGIGTDLTEQRRSEQEISRLARYDSLTSLPNRPMMRQTLDEALRNAARRQRACSLFLIDLDRFKNVNDTLGHPAGDALLKQVAQRLTAVLGDHGKVGRLGGDEFKAVLPGAAEVGLIENLARTLISEVSRPYDIDGHRVTIGASVGIAIGDPGRACADSMIRNADLALYAAKAAGRGKHCFYEPSMHSEATDRQMLENELRLALDRNELSVAYQPIIRVAGEEVAGFEALVRWSHPIRGSISPAKFIPLAEECGMIGPIGAWVLRTAIAEATNWPENVRIAINLSPIQFNDPQIVETVAEALRDTGCAPNRVELEITEGVFLADSDATEETFARLKRLGVRLVLDDFGTGYSSLGYLRHAPFDKIKIDQSFVRGAASVSSRNAALIRAIVTLAESLQMETVAEGVETHDDLALIRELGVAQVQGYIFGRPTDGEGASRLAKAAAVEADGHQFIRQPRQRLMRRAITAIQGQVREVRLRNISSTGALVECPIPVTPGMQIALDIVGVGPVGGIVRWASKDRFGLQFDGDFDLARLAPKPIKRNDVTVLRPWYVDQAAS